MFGWLKRKDNEENEECKVLFRSAEFKDLTAVKCSIINPSKSLQLSGVNFKMR